MSAPASGEQHEEFPLVWDGLPRPAHLSKVVEFEHAADWRGSGFYLSPLPEAGSEAA